MYYHCSKPDAPLVGIRVSVYEVGERAAELCSPLWVYVWRSPTPGDSMQAPLFLVDSPVSGREMSLTR